MGAGAVAGWLWTSAIAQPEAPPAAQQPPAGAPAPAPAPQQIQQVGQIISATPNSLTTSTPDGQTTTFRITADTTRIGAPATKSHVVVLGVVHDGVPVATAVADQNAIGPNGPPMDYDLPA
ncbi:hypothetical protein C6A87_027575 [Mycobacterium sp. ITM-2016-00317]|uniref:hypothetical protein n=1 Tax=Mycobacterium sp. ITM-2016-00317 TaxID=2099694 RepID=UPI00287F46AA|nr:hypothetical protein [Mycobacterium sp. ITM-2016-00317]WNG87453.1 hypothetical protein C6A87_027575 [Mycobacterium sp. ITM-2016-00317]